jgi:putative transposase
VENVWPRAGGRNLHYPPIRNTFRLASRADHDAIKRGVKAIYAASTDDAALVALDELEEKWGKKYRAVLRLRRTRDRVRAVLRLRYRDQER